MKTENLFEKSDFFEMSESDRIEALDISVDVLK